MTTPFNVTKDIFQKDGLLEDIPNMNYSTIATVTMAFKQNGENRYKDALNFFVSRNSDLSITTCTWLNHKWNNVAPPGYDLLRAYIGRVGDEAIVELSDEDIERTVRNDLEKALGITSSPEFTNVSRWKQSMPQYTVGHDERMQQVKEEIQHEFPQVMLVGSSYDGISVPDCITQGRNAALQLIENITERQLISNKL